MDALTVFILNLLNVYIFATITIPCMVYESEISLK